MPELFQDTLHSTLIPTKVASEISGYNADYLARLCREKKIDGTQVGRSWLINRSSLEAFVAEQEDRKKQRAEDLRTQREKEYRRAQKPMLKTTLAKTADMRDVVTRSVAGGIATSRARAADFARTTRRSFAPKIHSSHEGYSPRLAALAVALAVVAGTAYASTDARILTALGTIPNTAVRIALRTSPSTLEHSASFRITEADAPTNIAESIPTVPTARDASRAVALLMPNANVAALSSVRDLTDAARGPFAQTNAAAVASARIASVSDIAAHPGASLIRAYVGTGESIYDIGATIANAYANGIATVGDRALARAATLRDGIAYVPHLTNALLDGYANGIYAWNDAASKAPAATMLALYTVGDSISARTAAVPALALQEQKKIAYNAGETAHTGAVMLAAALAPSGEASNAPSSTQSPAMASVGALTKPFTGAYGTAVTAGGVILSLPVKAEDTILGVAGYASSLMDGTETPASVASTSMNAPQVALAQESGSSANNVDVSLPSTVSASAVSFLPASWQQAIGTVFHSVGTVASTFLSSAFHSLAFLFPNGSVMAPTLTVLHTGPTETLALPTPTGVAHGGGDLAISNDNRTIIQNVVNNYFPTGLVGGAFDSAVLAVVRPFVNDSIEASLKNNRGSGGSSSVTTSTGGVNSDGATLTNVTISSGNATVTALNASNSSLGTASATTFTAGTTTVGTTTVNGNLTITGTITAGSLSVGSLSYSGAVVAPSFQATDTAATSSFTTLEATKGVFTALTVGTDSFTSLLGNGLVNLGGFLSISTSSFSGSGSNFNADLLDGHDSTYLLANSFSTSSANAWMTSQTTDALAEGTLNQYFTNARARSALSVSGTGLSYASTTGIISVASGYSIPLTASTTDWNTAYLSRITVANAPLSILNNTLSLSQASASTDGYLSSADFNTFNSKQAALTFTYPLVNTANTISVAFGTSTSNTWGGTQIFTNAPVLGSLTGFLKATAGVLSTSLIDLSTDVSSTLPVSHGGTGSTSLTGLLKGNGTGSLLTAVDGTDYLSPSTFGSSFYTYFHATTTDALVQGSTNKYYSDTLARAAISSNAVGLTYTAGSGILSLTSGYSIPLTASTTEWSTFYATPSTRITAGTNLSWAGNTLNGPSDSYIHNLFSAASPLSYNAGTGAFTFSTSSISGAGSNLNADFLDGLDSTYFLANAFSTTSAAYWKTQNNFYSTTSADFWLTGKSTTNLAEGTNLYYTDARADARINATSTIGTLTSAPNLGTVKATLTGILKATSGVLSNAVAGTDYESPLTFTYPLTRSTNTISLAFGTTTANSWSSLQTFSAGINVGASTFTSLLGTGLTNVGGALTVATSTFSGSGSLFNADLLDGLDSTYFLANAFSTTSAAYWKTQNNFYSTTSADFWLTGKSTTNLAEGTNLYYTNNRVAGVIAGTTTDALAEGSVNKYYSDTLATANFVSNLAATTSVNSITTLANLSLPLTQTTGTLAQGRGGTGITSYTAGDILYADNSGNLAVLPVGATGQVLKVQAGLPSWGVDQTIGGGGSDGIFATSSGKIYPLDTANVLLVGTNATSTTNSIFEVNGIQYISSKLGIATTSPSAALSVAGNGLFSGTLTSGNIIDSGLTANSLLYADASKQLSSATLGTGLSFTGGALAVSTSTFSGSGSKFNADLLDGLDSTYFLANAFGTTSANYWLTTKSTTDLAEGTNLYFTNARADARINATSTIGTLTSAPNLGTLSTTLTGILKATSGVLSNAVAGTDYESPLTFTYPLTRSTNTISLAFGTTTANTWSSLQTFNGGVKVGSLSGVLYGNSGTVAAAATSTATLGTGLSYSGTLGSFVGGTSGTLSISTSTFSGSGSNFNADLLDGQDGTYYLANAFSTTSAAYWKTQNNFYSTTSADFWLTGKSTTNLAEGTNLYYTASRVAGVIAGTTTDALAQGSVNKYYSDTLARAALSSTATGLTYTSGTGVFSLTAGYTIPLTASTTDWNTAYLNRIASVSSPLSFTGNILSIAQAGTGSDGYLSSTDWNSFNSRLSTTTLGLFDKGYFFSTTSASYFLSQNQGAGYSTSSANYWLTTKSTTDLAEGTNLYFTNARADARINATSTIGTLTSAPNLGTVKTSLTGILKATSGVLSNAVAGTDYESPLTFTYPLQRTTNTISLAFGTTTANSWSSLQTFSAGINVGASTFTSLLGTGLSNVSGVLTVATSTFSGSGSLFNADLLDGYDSTAFLANGFSTTSADYWKTQRNFYSTTSADYWLTGKTTDNLTEGTTNLYWTNTRFDARLAATTTLPNLTTLANLGTVKTSLTGILKATSGVLSNAIAGTDYENPLTFTYPLTRSTNTISLAFGTTTANTWSSLQTFTSGINALGNSTLTNATSTNLFSTGLTANIAAFGQTGSTTVSSTGALTTPSLTIGSLSGLLKATSGAVSTAVSGTDYAPATTGSNILAGNGAGGFNAVSVSSPLTFVGTTLGIQKADNTQPGYLSSTDWTTFNGKQDALTFAYPLLNSANTISLAFGTTTANTWSGLNTFNGGVVANALTLGTLNGPLQANNGVVSATSSIGVRYGGTGLTSVPAYGQLLLGNGTGYTLTATSSLGLGASYFQQNGNAFGGLATLGTTDSNSLRIITAGIERARFDTSGSLLIGTTSNPNGSRVLVFGNGATTDFDIMGDPAVAGGLGDAAHFEAEGADFGVNGAQNSIAIRYYGSSYPSGVISDLGISTGNRGVLDFGTASTSIIETKSSTPILFGINNAEVMRLTSTGLGIGTTSPYAKLSVVGQTVSSYFTATTSTASTFPYASTTALSVSGGANALTIGSLSGLLKATSGAVSTAVSGTDYAPATTGSNILAGNGAGGFNAVSVSSPLTFVGTTLGIQKADNTQPGYLSSTDWSTFNGKQDALTFTYPIRNTANTISLAFGTTTANSWSSLQTFNGGITTAGTVTLGSLTGVLHAASGVVSASNVNLASEVTGTLPVANGGTGSTTLTGILKGNGTGGVQTAVAGTDYQAAGNYITALTGDVTATGPGSAAATLATVNSNVGSFGGSTAIPTFTVNAKGLITAAGSAAVIAPAGTLTGTTLASNVVTSSLTSVGTLSALTVSGNATLANATSTNEFSGRLTANTAAIGQTGSTTIASTGALTTPSLTIGSLSGVLKAASGVVSAATAGTDYQAPITLTTTGTSGAATFVGNTLNIPQYQAAGTYVTSISVASANGFTGSSSGGATPALTLGTSITGLLKGNGTAISAATAGTDYENPLTFGYPLVRTTNAISLAFGTTTANTWSALNTFNAGLTTNALTLGTLNGPLQANNGVISATTSIGVLYGGTGLTAAPAFGQLLVGNGTGYTLTATSSLGLLTTNVSEGTNLYFTNARADARINATSTIGTLTSAPNLGTLKTTLTGILKASSGVLSNAVAGTDYESPLTFTYPLKRSTNTINLDFGTTTANTWAAQQTFSGGLVAAAIGVQGVFLDGSASAGTNGQILQTTGSTVQWVSTSTLGLGTGSVTSVNASGGTTGLSFSGGPITSSGTLTLAGTLGVANGGTGSTTLSGILLGNGTSAVQTLGLGTGLSLGGGTLSIATSSLFTGTTGQFPYFSGTNTLTATSSLFLAASGNIGLGTTTPTAKLALAGGNFLQSVTTAPVVAGSVSIASASNGIGTYVQGHYAYSVDAGSGFKLSIIDITTPTAPVVIGTVSDVTNLAGAFSVKVAGNYAYVTATSGGRLTVVDITNPSAPVVAGVLTNSALGGARGLYLSGRYAYVAGNTSGALAIVDISNPTSPVLVGSVTSSGNLDAADSVYVAGKYAYVTSTTNNKLTIVDITNPAAPTVVGSYGSVTNISNPKEVWVAGRYAYVLGQGSNSLAIIDVSTPSSPTLAGVVFDGTALNNPKNMFLAGRYAYVTANNGSRLTVIDVSNPAAPFVVSSLNDGTNLSNARGVFVSGKYAYVSAGSKFTVVDIAGIDVPSANLGVANTEALSVYENGDIGNDLYVRNGLTVGAGGIYSGGSLSVLGTAGVNPFTVASSTGTNLLTLTGAGNLGIGTSTPWANLAIDASAGAYPFAIGSSTNPVFTVLPSGSVSVGTINETIASSGFLATRGDLFASGSLASEGVIYTDSGLNLNGASILDSGANLLNLGGTIRSGTGNGLSFQTNGASTARLVIDTSGNVGIGTSTPYAQLALGGGNLVLGAATAGGTPGDLFLPKLGTSAGSFLAVDATGKVISTTTPSISLTGTTGQIAYFSGTNTAIGTSTIFISTAGKVGIGTTVPSALLHITGTQPAAGTTGTGAPTTLQVAGITGGDNNATSGTASGGAGSAISLIAGSGGAITGTPATGFGGAGGNITLTAGNGGAGGGTSAFAGSAGNVTITAGSAANTSGGTGGSVSILAGSATGGGTAGGNIYISGGAGTSNPVGAGNVILGVPSGVAIARGFIGIGTTTPWGLLSVDPETSNLPLGAPEFVIGSSSATHLLLTAAGNLGLGTTSPYAQLSITGNAVLGAATAGGTPGDLFLPKLGTAAGSFLAVDATGKVIATTTPTGGGGGLTGSTGQVAYFSGTNTAVGTSTLSITTGSNVGIGTSTPWAGYKLAVNGGTLIHATTNYNLLLDSNGLSAQDDSGATAAMTITGGTATLQATADANVKSLVSGAVRLSTAAGEKLTVTSGGNVGIASTTPTSAFSVGATSYFGANVGIGSSSPTTALSFAAGATTAAQGINFGDTTANLYRSAAGTIKTDGNLSIGGGTITALTPTIINTNGSTIFSNNNGAESFISSSGSAQSDVITTGGRAVLTLGSVVTWAPNSATNSAVYTGLTVSPTVNAGASNVGGTFYGVRINPTFTSTTGLTATYLFGVASANNDKFVINSTGLVGAGTTTPAGAQIVASNATLPQLLLTDTSLTNNQWGFRNAGGNLYIATTSPSTNATSTATAFTIASDGGLVAYNATGGSKGIGTINAQTVYANNVALTSDVRYKKDIQALDDSQGLSFIQSLAPVSYHWADATMGTDLNLGFIAQDVQKIAPELVSVGSDKDHTLALNYIGLISPAVKAIQELAVQTSDLSLATTSLATKFASLSASVNASLADIQLPHALTATVVTADSMTIAQGVSAGTLTTQSVTAFGTVSAARYVVPLTANVFSFGSTTMSMHVPDEALASGGNVDLYKLAGYAVAGTDALAARTDLLATKLDDLTTRIAALEALHAATTTASTTDGTSTAEGALGLTITTIQDALKGLGIIIHKGYLALDSLVTHQLFLVKGEDGTSSTGSQVIPAGATTLNVTNPLVHPSSKIFLTFTSSVDGSWYLSKKQEGSFTITLAKPQPADTEFDYFLLQTDPNAQVAAVDQANQPPVGASEAPTAPASVSQDGGPVVSLNGAAAIQLAQGATWTDPGAHAAAADGTDLTSSITVAGSVDTNTAGLYTLTYNVVDASGKGGQASRVVSVLAPTTAPTSGTTVTDTTGTGSSAGGSTGGSATGSTDSGAGTAPTAGGTGTGTTVTQAPSGTTASSPSSDTGSTASTPTGTTVSAGTDTTPAS